MAGLILVCQLCLHEGAEMSNINLTLKLNGLNCLFFGALFVFIPNIVIQFLSTDQPAPEVVILVIGVVLNLYGLLLLWIANKKVVSPSLVLWIAIGDFLWVLGTVVLFLSGIWITDLNGMTVAGLVAILVGWLGWLQLQYYLANKSI